MKKGYTLIELIIVIVIVSILIATISVFIPKDKDKQIASGQDCLSFINNQISKEISNIDKNKLVNISGNDYQINNLEIIFSKNTSGSNKIYTTINLKDYETPITNILLYSGGICKNIDNYNIILSTGAHINITNNKFSIINHKEKNKEILINTCKESNCIKTNKILINKISKTIKNKECSVFSGYNCIKWNN